MRIRYTPYTVRTAVPALGGATLVLRPLLALRITGPSGSRLRDGILDTGADETIVDPSVAPLIGVDSSQAPEREIHLIGRGRIRCRYAPVQLRISDGIAETYEWDTVVGFAPFPILRALLGFAGFLQFFDADFHGADQEVTLLPNASFAGRRI
jgi:hypothetical protein